jgi:hypothetical protein
MLQMLALGEDDAVLRRQLRINLEEMGRLLGGMAFEIERCIPADGKHGPLSRQIIGLPRL